MRTFADGGVPTLSRASSLTAVTARNRFVFFLRAIADVAPMLP